MITPNEWPPAILDAVLPKIVPSRFQRFMDLLMMRAQTVSDLAFDTREFVASMSRRSKKGQADWARGFADATEKFRAAWPKKGMTVEDLRHLEIVSGRLVNVERSEFAALIALRQAKNAG